MSSLVTSTRMYNATPTARRAWQALLERALAGTGAQVDFIEHGFPTPIDDLWREPTLFAAFMCGWPFSRADRAMQPIAVPIPAPGRYEGRPRYLSEFLVREASGWTSLEQTFGHRIGWMARDSQSGFNAPRHVLSAYARERGGSLYSESRGPYVTPMKTLEALRNEEVDVVALDGFFLDLLRRHEPGRLSGLRTIAETPWTPMPLLVAAPGVEASRVERMRSSLLRLGEQPGDKALLADVILRGFAVPRLEDYEVFERMAREAEEAGYPQIR
jgi:ABC-type phosphate/phosphonate transport system substrate-binding protein